MVSPLLPPQVIYLLNSEVPKEDAQRILTKCGYDVETEQIQPLGGNPKNGYHVILENGDTRCLYQASIKEVTDRETRIYGQFVLVHEHKEIEKSFVAYGGANVWQYKNSVWEYEFYKQGDFIEIPAHVPHCVVAASYIAPDMIEQLGIVMVRNLVDKKDNPQLFEDDRPSPPEVFQNALDALSKPKD